jgi:molybdenum cofactor cytidylyltransferase
MRDSEAKFALAAVILAAGSSTRMGRPKLLLPWRNSSILGHLVRQWKDLGALQIGVVCARSDALIHAELHRLKFPLNGRIENPDPGRGMFSSVQCAARWLGWNSALTHWAIVLGDQPHLRQQTLARVRGLAVSSRANVVQPSHAGHRGHPIFIAKPAFSQLQYSAAATLKQFLATYEVDLAECDDPGLDLDLDRPEDYKRALELAALPGIGSTNTCR